MASFSETDSSDLDEIRVEKVISGGQVGVDLAALRAARACGIATGGVMPRGFRTSNGNKPYMKQMYGMEELGCKESLNISMQYVMRSRENVDAADGCIAFRTHPSPGTDKTLGYCEHGRWAPLSDKVMRAIPYDVDIDFKHRPCFIVPLFILVGKHSETVESERWEKEVERAQEFLREHDIRVLNVFGHRSEDLGERAYDFLKCVFTWD